MRALGSKAAALVALVALSLPGVCFADAGEDPESSETEATPAETEPLVPEAEEPTEEETEELDEAEETTPSAPTQEDVDRSLDSVLGRHPLEFCKDATYRVPENEKNLCRLASESKSRCPAFADACKGMRATAPDQPNPERERDPELRSGGSLSSLALVVFWGLILAAVIALLAVLVKSFRSSSLEPRAKAEMDALETPDAPDAPRPRVVETDVDRLLARARARARGEDYAGAIIDAHAAVLRHLELDGKLELHPSRTNGDYLRALRFDAELFARVREVTGEVDRAQFAGSTPPPEAFERALRIVLPLVGKAVLLAFSLGLLATPTACGGQPSRDDERGVSLGTTPAGHSLLAELLSERGATVHHRLSAVDEIDPMISRVLVLDTDLDDEEWRALLGFAAEGGTLLVAGAFGGPLEETFDVRSTSIPCTTNLHVHDRSYTAYALGIEGARVLGTPEHTLTIAGNDAEPLLECDFRSYLEVRTHGNGQVILLADSSFLSNASLLSGENARVVLGLLETQRRIEIIDVWTTRSAKTPLSAISNAHLTPFFTQALVLLLLLAAWRGIHFGRPRDLPEKKRRVFAEHVRALGLTYARARASRLALAHYAAWALDRLRERTLPGGGKLSDLARATAQRVDQSEAEVMRTLVDARSAFDESDFGPTSRGSWAPASEQKARHGAERFDLDVLRALGALIERAGGSKR